MVATTKFKNYKKTISAHAISKYVCEFACLKIGEHGGLESHNCHARYAAFKWAKTNWKRQQLKYNGDINSKMENFRKVVASSNYVNDMSFELGASEVAIMLTDASLLDDACFQNDFSQFFGINL